MTTKLNECGCAEMPVGAPPGGQPAVLKDCLILGLKSRNNRVYLTETLRKALSLYEGKQVFFDHAPEHSQEPRKFIEKFGKFKNVRLAPSGIRGDFWYNPKHLYTNTFLGWLEVDPTAIGFSHAAEGKVREGKNGEPDEVYEITAVDSVDLVADAASTKGLFEAKTRESMDPLLNPTAATGDPNAPPGGASPTGDTGYEQHIGHLVAAIVNDQSLSIEQKRKKVLVALKLIDENDVAKPEEEGTEEPPAEAPVEESEEAPEESGEDEGSDEGEDEKAMEALKKSKNKSVRRLLTKLDEYKVKDKLEEKRKKAYKRCADFDLPVDAITSVFLETLLSVADDEVKLTERVKDRKAALNRGPVSLPSMNRHSGVKELTVDDLVKSLSGV